MLVAVQVAISLAYVASHLSGDVPQLIDLDGEANLPVWWSSTLLLAVGAVAGALVLCERRLGCRWWPLLVLAAGLVGLSLEEVARIHESVGARLDVTGTVADWTVVYLPVLVLGAWVVLRVVRELPRGLGALLALGLAAFAVGVATEMSLLSGDDGATAAPAPAVSVLLEENAEFVGTLLTGAALLTRLRQRLPLVAGFREPHAVALTGHRERRAEGVPELAAGARGRR